MQGFQEYYNVSNVSFVLHKDRFSVIFSPKQAVLSYWDSLAIGELVGPNNVDEFACTQLIDLRVTHHKIPTGFAIQNGSPFKEALNSK